jgi:hypothetical protein
MRLRHFESTGPVRWTAIFALVSLAVAVGCERDDPPAVDRNRPPETYVTQGPPVSPDPENPTPLFYRSHLYWRGEDVDGTVVGFQFAIDDTAGPVAWTFTTQTDSVFRFRVAEIGPREHLFLIRSVDNEGKFDPSPDSLRFEASSEPPVVRFTDVYVNGVLDPNIANGDTVQVMSDVTVCWTGSDPDGVVEAWETKFNAQRDWTFHERNDTCLTRSDLPADWHTFTVRAIDDAGGKSFNEARFRIRSNFDPKTQIDTTSIVATLPTPWIHPDSSLTVRYRDGMGGAQDTMPLNSRVSFCWSSTDIDGPVVRYQWQVGSNGGATESTCATTDSLLSTSSTDVPRYMFVKGIDIYGSVEQAPDSIPIHVNFAPRVQFVVRDTQDVYVPEPFRFYFTGTDIDSDPDSLEFLWRFLEFEPSFSTPIRLMNDSTRFVERAFVPSQVGVGGPIKRLLVKAHDASGTRRESLVDTAYYRIIDTISVRTTSPPEKQ